MPPGTPLLRLFALALIALLSALAATPSVAKAPPLVLQNELAVGNLGPHISYYRDENADMSLQQALDLHGSGAFKTVTESHFDAGFGDRPYWLVIEIESKVPGNQAALIATNISFVPAIDIYWLQDGEAPRLLQRKTKTTPFDWSQHIGLSIVSNQFILKQGDRGKLVIRFTPYGMGLLPLSLETPESIFARTSLDNIGYTAFYVFALSMLALFIVFNLALGSRGLVYFVFLFTSALLLIAQIDGFPNAYVWPNWPRWNLVASFPLFTALNIASLLVAGYMLREGGYIRLGQALARIWPLFLVPLAAALVLPVVWLILPGLTLLPVSMSFVFFAIFVWAREMRGQRYVAILASAGMLIGVGFYMFYTLYGDADVADSNRQMLKVLYALGSVSIMASYATHAAALNRNYRTALQREVEAARRDAELSQSLLNAERNFNRARDLAQQRGRQLASAAHDLRQPVASLRLMMDSFARNAEPSVRANLARAFDYLDGLVQQNLDAVRPKSGDGTDELAFEDEADNEDANGTNGNGASADAETFSLGIVLQASAEIYREEAISKQIEFRVVPSTLDVSANAIALMRILGNLVSNAVKHTGRGKVLIGVRRGGKRPRLIVADTGEGMSAEELARFRTAYAKGESSDGEGLGLAICFELAEKNGLKLDVVSEPGKGTCFTLGL